MKKERQLPGEEHRHAAMPNPMPRHSTTGAVNVATTARSPHRTLFNPKRRWSLANVRMQIMVAQERGLSLDCCLQGSCIAAEMLEDPHATICAEQEIRVISNVLDALGDGSGGLGLEVGARYRLTTFGTWGFTLLCSPTLRAALDTGLGFIDLSQTLASAWMEQSGSECSLYFSASFADPRLRIFSIERAAACTITLQREILGSSLPLYRLWFNHAPQTSTEVYRRILGIDPEFERAANVGSFDARLLDLPLPRSNELSWRQCQAQSRELLQQRQFGEGLAGRMREVLLRNPAQALSLDTIASHLQISTPQLRRQLAAEGVSYRALVDELKRAQAEQMLLVERTSIQQTADQLGYESVSSFSHSFKRWTGLAPGEFISNRQFPAAHAARK